ncbi:hypothetical protein Pint_14999 [Pistacia integerrima]|uniref:Uncharacterized protein n=1 Tax=Pistacia integerrima TaxID=434235 RepID=A0ACC0ZE47_9ROSI|nr:hypothetical protein Pint_14999 [Pistacia integerrima]
MTKKEMKNGEEEMLIDRPDQEPVTPDGFNSSHLKEGFFLMLISSCRCPMEMVNGKHPGCNNSYFGQKEFSFTLDNDIYLRLQSFSGASELENAIKEKCPFKVDIQPVYTVDPAKRHGYAQGGDNNAFSPVERELVFDIDITEYDDVRYCCSGADVCLRCWPLMTASIKVIDTALRGRSTSISARCFLLIICCLLVHAGIMKLSEHEYISPITVTIYSETCRVFILRRGTMPGSYSHYQRNIYYLSLLSFDILSRSCCSIIILF